MFQLTRFGVLMIALAAVLLGGVFAIAQEQPAPGDEAAKTSPSERRVQTVAEARRQAILLHATIHSSLQLVHDRYYREDEGLPLPAATFREVFRAIEEEQQVKLRWLAVEGQAMNTDHKPQDSFEEQAVQALKAGRASYEQVSGETYRRAAPIRLSNHCLKCHVPDRRSTKDRTAGLIIQMPVRTP